MSDIIAQRGASHITTEPALRQIWKGAVKDDLLEDDKFRAVWRHHFFKWDAEDCLKREDDIYPWY